MVATAIARFTGGGKEPPPSKRATADGRRRYERDDCECKAAKGVGVFVQYAKRWALARLLGVRHVAVGFAVRLPDEDDGDVSIADAKDVAVRADGTRSTPTATPDQLVVDVATSPTGGRPAVDFETRQARRGT